jgi:2-methylcitrate dehydratase PrpD
MLRRFAEFAVAQREDALPDAVGHAAVRAIVDWFGATLAGAAMPPARILTAALADETGPARIVGGTASVRPRTAALVNGTAAHTAELDDIYRQGIYHPGAPTVAAALAVAEDRDASGADLVRAVTVGYEISDRIAAAVNPTHYRYWHTTGTIGTLGAAAAVADLLDLDEDQFAHALATATTMAAGLQQAFRSDAMSKPLHSGHAAEAGTLAALAAAHGFTGALDVLEGEAGFAAAMAGGADLSAVHDGLGTDYLITQTTAKNHSCCGHTFAAVDAAIELRGRGVRADEVAEIEIATYGTALKVAGNPDPATEFEAKFSLPYCVAVAMVTGSARLRAFTEEQRHDPAVLTLMRRVSLHVDDEFDAAFPGRRAARVTVVDTDGTRHEVTRLTRKGDPDDPLTDEELGAKYTELAEPALGERRAAELGAALWRLREVASVRELEVLA